MNTTTKNRFLRSHLFRLFSVRDRVKWSPEDSIEIFVDLFWNVVISILERLILHPRGNIRSSFLKTADLLKLHVKENWERELLIHISSRYLPNTSAYLWVHVGWELQWIVVVERNHLLGRRIGVNVAPAVPLQAAPTTPTALIVLR